MARIVALDYGRRYLGVAVTDPSGTIAQPFRVLKVRGLRDAVHKIRELLHELNATTLVIGIPYLPSGKEGEMVREVQRFCKELEEELCGVTIHFQDERWTSAWGERIASTLPGAPAQWEHALSAQALLYDYLSRCERS